MKDLVKIFILIIFLILSKITLAQCDFYNSVIVNTNSFESGSGFTQEYVLVKNSSGIISQINTSGNFTTVIPGEYLVYAVNYQGGTPSVLAVGNSWTGVSSYDANSSNCFASIGAYNGGPVIVCDQVCTGNPFSATSNGFYTGGSTSQTYVMVASPMTGNILASNGAGSFTSTEYVSDGLYAIYAVNTEDAAVINNIETGDAWPTAETTITSNCADYIGPYLVEVSTASCPLPISEIKLSGLVYNSYNKLDWLTNLDEEVDFYEILRSKDALKFEKIGVTNESYFGDKEPFSLSYYKLKIHLKNKEIKFSNTISLNRKSDFSIVSLYPNPTKGIINLNLQSEEGVIQLEINNAIGQIIQSSTFNVESGINNIQLDISSLPESMYILSINNGVRKIQQKVVKF